MTTPFYERLTTAQRNNDSLVCVGLDTDPSRLPASLKSRTDAVVEFNRKIIDATHDLVCAYKLNLAFYEALGDRCWDTIHRTLQYIPQEIVTIGDAKRGDIGNTATMYARSMFDDYQFSATTVNPFMGKDSVAPFLVDPARGTFVLALTSNPGAKDFQYLRFNKKPLYEHIAARVKKWNTKKNCGLVVGATRPRELQRLRAIVPHMPFLIPGIGTQGGDLRSAVRYGCDKQGMMAVINASRSVLYASAKDDFADAARDAAISLRAEINILRAKYFKK